MILNKKLWFNIIDLENQLVFLSKDSVFNIRLYIPFDNLIYDIHLFWYKEYQEGEYDIYEK